MDLGGLQRLTRALCRAVWAGDGLDVGPLGIESLRTHFETPSSPQRSGLARTSVRVCPDAHGPRSVDVSSPDERRKEGACKYGEAPMRTSESRNALVEERKTAQDGRCTPVPEEKPQGNSIIRNIGQPRRRVRAPSGAEGLGRICHRWPSDFRRSWFAAAAS